MPLTVAHPVVAVPFRKLGLLLSPLIVGSIIPDFEFFLRLSTQRLIAHTPLGLFLFCIPVGLLSLLLFHKVLKFPLISVLPKKHREKLLPVAREFTFLPLSRFFNIVMSLLVGAVSHIVFDALTHSGSFLTTYISWFDLPLFYLFGNPVRVYFFLQYLFSAIGVLALMHWYWSWYKGAQRERCVWGHHFPGGKRALFVSAIAFCTVFGGAFYGILTSYHLRSIGMVREFVSNAAIASVSSFLLAVLLFAFLWHWILPTRLKMRLVYRKLKSIDQGEGESVSIEL